MKFLYLKFVILFIFFMTQPIKIVHADIIDNSTIDNRTTNNSVLDNTTIDNYTINQPLIKNPSVDNSTSFSSLFLNIGFATDLFITNGPFDLDSTSILLCGNIDVGKVIYKVFGVSAGYSNCNGSSSSAHKAKIQLLLQRMIDKNKFQLTPYLTAGIKYQSLKLRTSKVGAFNAFGTNISIGLRYNIYSFLISAEIDFTYTLFFREASSPTHAVIASALIKIGVLF